MSAETGAVNKKRTSRLRSKLSKSAAESKTQQGAEETSMDTDQAETQPETQPETQAEETQQAAMTMRTMAGSQPSMLDFFERRSSTLRDSVTEDTEDEKYESAAEDTPKVPKFTSTQAAADTLTLKTPVAKKLQFRNENYELVRVTPGGAEGGTGEVTVKIKKPATFADLRLSANRKPQGKVSRKPRTPLRKNVLGKFNKPDTPASNRKRSGSGGQTAGKIKRLNDAQDPPASFPTEAPQIPGPGAQQVSDQQAQQAPEQLQQAPVEEPRPDQLPEETDQAQGETEAPTPEPEPEKQGETGQSTGESAGGDDTKEEDISVKSDDLSSLSILFCEPPVDNELDQTVLNNTLEETALIDDSNVTIRARDSETSGDTDTTQDTVIERILEDENQEPESGATGGGSSKVILVKEYNSAEKGSPDKPLTPPRDYTGHMVSVHAMTPKEIIDSSVENQSLMKKISKPLVNISAEMVEAPDTEQKKKQGSEID